MKKRYKMTLSLCLWCLMLFVMTPHHSLAAQENFENPLVLKASEILTPQLVSSEYHEVEEEVENDGYLNFYRISSDFGTFEAQGTSMLKIRVKEIHALAELERLSRTEIFLDAAKDAGVDKVESVVELAEKSVEITKKSIEGAKDLSLEDVKSGAGQIFERTKAETEEKIDKSVKSAKKAVGDAKEWLSKKKWKKDKKDKEESAKEREEQKDADSETEEESKWKEWREKFGGVARDLGDRYLGVSKAERQWAEKLGTDPYTSNDVLAEAIRQTARVDRLGNLSTGMLVSVPEVPGTKEIVRFGELIWGKDVEELEDLNTQQLADTGAEAEMIAAFFQHPQYQSPSQQTLFATSLSKLEGVEHRAALVEHALAVDSEVEARFFLESVALLAWYHQQQAPLSAVLEDIQLPFAITQDGRLISLLPVDYLFWTEGIAKAVQGFAASLEALPVGQGEFWASGKVSERCREELAALGWTVRENVAEMVQLQ